MWCSITPSRRTSSFASSSERESPTTVRPGHSTSSRAASASASQVKPSWRAFSTTQRRWAAKDRSAFFCPGQRAKGTTRSGASLSSMWQ